MRINKFLASCGIGSRRAVEKYIRDGRVKINDVVVRNLSRLILETDVVEFDGCVVSVCENKVYIVMNKPRGCVTTCKDDKGRRTVIDVLNNFSQNGEIPRVFPVGRLDYDTEGLLLLTNDGDFAMQVTHPSSQIYKTYIATLDGEVPEMQNVREIAPGVAEVKICEGKNRQVRKMFEAVGLAVLHLERISIGGLKLNKLKLQKGEWKFIQKPSFK